MGWDEECIARERVWHSAAAEAGLLCWPFLRELASPTTPAKAALLRRVVTEFRDSPGMGLWKGADEPAWGKKPVAPQVSALQIIREADGRHPTVLIHAPRNTTVELEPYNAAADIIGADIYPVSYPMGLHVPTAVNPTIALVGEFTRKMANVSQLAPKSPGSRLPPVWMTLQIAWSGVAKPGKTLRFPTAFEARFMAYQAVVNGARGLFFFGGNLAQTLSAADRPHGWNWEYWTRSLRPIVEQLGLYSPIHPALVATHQDDHGVAARALAGGSAVGIEFVVRETESEVVLIACNAREGPATLVQFNGLSTLTALQPNATYPVVFEDPRVVTASAASTDLPPDAFEDWFAAFDVHVYQFPRRV
jgi:hypothetical protein